MQTVNSSNQVPTLININRFSTDVALKETISYFSGSLHHKVLQQYANTLADEEVVLWAKQANTHVPLLHQWSATGNRIDNLEFHPSWHKLMGMAVQHGLHCHGWSGQPNAHLLRAAKFYMHGQVEAGTLCPLTMTSASIPILSSNALTQPLANKASSLTYDKRNIAPALKNMLIMGMGLTEKQGGSDLRNTSTTANHAPDNAPKVLPGQQNKSYHINGHKWFFSVPQADAHLVLARSNAGLSCFLVPRYLDNGQRNNVYIQRLKDKLGNRSNASAEVVFENALGVMVGEPGRGLPLLLKMASHTRLDCVLGSAALMRSALVQAIHFARNRKAFGNTLINHPLMQTVLADLAIESEAATTLALHLAAAMDSNTEADQFWVRVITPAAKYWVCKRAVHLVSECLEVLGGNGYIEDGPMASIYRESPVNSIWEGSANIMCLDVLRALNSQPDQAKQLIDNLRGLASISKELAVSIRTLLDLLKLKGPQQEAMARRLVSLLVRFTQAQLLQQHAPEYVFKSFIQGRFVDGHTTLGETPLQDGLKVIERCLHLL